MAVCVISVLRPPLYAGYFPESLGILCGKKSSLGNLVRPDSESSLKKERRDRQRAQELEQIQEAIPAIDLESLAQRAR